MWCWYTHITEERHYLLFGDACTPVKFWYNNELTLNDDLFFDESNSGDEELADVEDDNQSKIGEESKEEKDTYKGDKTDIQSDTKETINKLFANQSKLLRTMTGA